MRMTGDRIPLRNRLLAIIADNTAMTAWLLSDAARRGEGRPESVLTALTAEPQKRVIGFDSPDAFRAARDRIIKEGAKAWK